HVLVLCVALYPVHTSLRNQGSKSELKEQIYRAGLEKVVKYNRPNEQSIVQSFTFSTRTVQSFTVLGGGGETWQLQLMAAPKKQPSQHRWPAVGTLQFSLVSATGYEATSDTKTTPTTQTTPTTTSNTCNTYNKNKKTEQEQQEQQ
ncbi:unnamed protein product, partial [Polarella glacialis]